MMTKQRRNDVTPSQGFLKDFPKVLVIPCWVLLELFDHQSSTSKSKDENGNFDFCQNQLFSPYLLSTHVCIYSREIFVKYKIFIALKIQSKTYFEYRMC